MRLTSAEKLNNVVVLTIGNRNYTKQQCVDFLKTGNWRACRILHLVLVALGIRTTRQLYQLHWSEIWEGGAGYMTMLVATHLLHEDGYDASEWLTRERDTKAPPAKLRGHQKARSASLSHAAVH